MQIKKWTSKDTVCLDVGMSTSYKQKKTLIDLLTSTGCKVSFVLNKNVKFLIRDDGDDFNTYKCRTALKLGIPILHANYVYECSKNGGTGNTHPKIQDYILKNKKSETNFTNGIISSSNQKKCKCFDCCYKIF